MGVEDQSSDSHTCMASSLKTEQSTLKPFFVNSDPCSLSQGLLYLAFPYLPPLPFLYWSYFPVSLRISKFLMFWTFQLIYFSDSGYRCPNQGFYLVGEGQHSVLVFLRQDLLCNSGWPWLLHSPALSLERAKITDTDHQIQLQDLSFTYLFCDWLDDLNKIYLSHSVKACDFSSQVFIWVVNLEWHGFSLPFPRPSS